MKRDIILETGSSSSLGRPQDFFRVDKLGVWGRKFSSRIQGWSAGGSL